MLLRRYHGKPELAAPKAVDDMTKAELIALAAATGIDLGAAKSKAEILAVVTAAAAAPAGEEPEAQS